jgi:hypothetical protein
LDSSTDGSDGSLKHMQKLFHNVHGDCCQVWPTSRKGFVTAFNRTYPQDDCKKNQNENQERTW